MALALGGRALADDEIARAPAADWVEILGIPEPDAVFADQVQGGKHYLLSETQIRPVPNGWETYSRVAYKVVDRTGLESAASVSLEFNPAAERVTLNRMRVIRDGRVIERAKDVRIDIARRETDAERGIFDGRLTAYFNLEDVRVGDVVDWASTVRYEPTIGEELFYARYVGKWMVPVGRFRIKAYAAPGHELFHASREIDVQPTIDEQDGRKAYIWNILNPKPIADQPNAPADFPVQGSIEISSTRDWADIVRAVRPHYRLDQQLPRKMREKLDDIASRYAAPQDRLVAALRMVQDDIRYVSLAMGTGSYIPRPPAEVMSTGFGDCKDKSLLLAIALRTLGIEADVALTHSSEGASLKDRLPALSVFDHAIVRARIEEKGYWLDPTNYLQGGRADTLEPPQFAYALPLDETPASLQPIERPKLTEPSQIVKETFDMPGSNGRPMGLRVHTTFRGAQADSMRYRLMNESRVKLANDYVKYYDGLYPRIRSVAPLEVEDDRDENRIEVRERYELDEADLSMDDLIKNFQLKADLALADFPTPSRVDRTAPVWIGQPVFKQHKTLVRNLKARFRAPDGSMDMVSPFAMLTSRTKATGSSFQVVWTFMTFTDRIPPSFLGTYSRRLDDLWAKSKWTYDFSYVDPPAK